MYNAARSFAIRAAGLYLHCQYNGKAGTDLRQASQA